MRAGQTTLKRLIEGEKQYRIPLFQRPYTGRGLELRQLWSDVLAQYESQVPDELNGPVRLHRSSHFLGSFVLSPVPGLASGVSAHSWLTASSASRPCCLQSPLLRDAQVASDDRAVERYNQLYLRNEYRADLDWYKLVPSRLDRSDFFACIDGKPRKMVTVEKSRQRTGSLPPSWPNLSQAEEEMLNLALMGAGDRRATRGG